MNIEQGTVNQRFEQLIRKFDNGNRSAFARRVDLTPGTIADIVGGRFNKPRFEVLQKVFYALPNLNKDWLMFGEGPMTLDNEPVGPPWASRKAQHNQQGIEAPYREYYGYLGNYPILTTAENTVVPIIEARRRRDYLGYNNENPPASEDIKYYEPFESLSLPMSLIPSGEHRAFTVTDYRMEPILTLADYIICSRIQQDDWEDISESTICAVVSKTHSILIARITIHQKKNAIICSFENSSNNYPIRIKFEDIEEIWSFMWRLTSTTESNFQSLQQEVSSIRRKVDRALGTFREQLRDVLTNRFTEEDLQSQQIDASILINDEQVRALYVNHYGPIESDEKYRANVHNTVTSLLFELILMIKPPSKGLESDVQSKE
jgi:hypothetical protein